MNVVATIVQICRREKGFAMSVEPSYGRIYCGDIFATMVIANTIATTHVVANTIATEAFASNYLRRRVSDYMSSQKTLVVVVYGVPHTIVSDNRT